MKKINQFLCLNSTFPQINPGNLEFGLAYIPDHYSMKQKLSKQLGGEPTAKQAHQCAKCQKTLDIDIDPRTEGPHLCIFCSIPDGTIVWSLGNDDRPNFRLRKFGGLK